MYSLLPSSKKMVTVMKKVKFGLHRFMKNIADYYHDKGMPIKTAKARMYDETFDACYELMKKEEDIPDHALVILMQFASRMLNQRGYEITNEVKSDQDVTSDDFRVQALRQIKQIKDEIDTFIAEYRGADKGAWKK